MDGMQDLSPGSVNTFPGRNKWRCAKLSNNGGRYISGLILVLIGVILLLPNLGISIFYWGNIWPLFIILGGLAFLTGWVVSSDHDAGLAFVGTGGLLSGCFLGLFAWDILAWGRMADWWPAFPLIGGVAFLVLWLADRRRDPGVLVPACGGILTGGIAFLFTMYKIDWAIAVKWWPALLIALGLLIAVSRLLGPSETAKSEDVSK